MRTEGAQAIRRRLESELGPGERLVWSEQPDPAVHARQESTIFVFGIVWCVLIAAFNAATLHMGDASAAVMFGIFAIPFWLVGFWMLGVRRRARARAARTIYGITEQRALILTTGTALEVHSFYSVDLGKIKRVEREDGSGNIILRQDLKSDGDGGKMLSETGFIGIKDVRRVERLLADVRAHAA